MAAEDFKTLREVGIAIEGIKGRLNLMAGVFAVSVLIGVGALGYVANRVNTVAEDVAEMKGQLAGVSQQLASIKAGVEALQSLECSRTELHQHHKIYALPIRIPVRKTSTPPTAIWPQRAGTACPYSGSGSRRSPTAR